MKITKIYLFILIIFSILLSTCKKSEDNPIIFEEKTDDSNISGIIKDADGSMLAGVKVSIGSNSTISDANGKYILTKLVEANSIIVTFSKTGYVTTQKTSKTKNYKTISLNASLAKIGKTVTLSNVGGSIDFNGATVVFPPNAFIDLGGNLVTGDVIINATYFDPTSKEFNNVFPGNFEGKRADGSTSMIESFGFIDIEIYKGSDKLNLAKGKEATITIPIPKSISSKAPSTIPLWYYDINEGAWIEQGVAGKEGDFYIGKVSHFTPWNFDQVVLTSYVEGRVVDKNGVPLSDVKIISVGDDYTGNSFTYSDELGNYKVLVKSDSKAKIYAVKGRAESLGMEVKSLPLRQVLKIEDIILNLDNTTIYGWYKQDSKFVKEGISSIFFIDENEGWATTHANSVIHTMNGGTDWNKISTFQYSPGNLYFIDRLNGFMVSFNPSQGLFSTQNLYRTKDGGKTWNFMRVVDDNAGDFKFFGNIGYLFGDDIFKTTDAGDTWVQLKRPSSYMSISIIDKDNIICLSSPDEPSNALLKSTDGGDTWKSSKNGNVILPSKYKNCFEFIDINTGFISNSDYGVYMTKDGGSTWNICPSTKGKGINYIKFADSKTGWCFNTTVGLIFKTSDGGLNWKEQYYGIDKSGFRSFHSLNSQKAWLIGYYYDILHTDTGGE